MSRECITHHHACDCREARFAAFEAQLAAVTKERDELKADRDWWKREHASLLVKSSERDKLTRAVGSVLRLKDFPILKYHIGGRHKDCMTCEARETLAELDNILGKGEG